MKISNQSIALFGVILLVVFLFRKQIATTLKGQGTAASMTGSQQTADRPKITANSPAPGSGFGTAEQAAEASGLNTAKVLKQGDQGEEVKYLQQLLQSELYLLRGEDDGIFGPKTATALQEARGVNQISIDQFLKP